MNHCTKFKALIGASLLTVGLGGCSPERWEHTDILQLNAAGDVVHKCIDCSIDAVSGILSSASWIRYRTKEGKLVTVYNSTVRIEYR